MASFSSIAIAVAFMALLGLLLAAILAIANKQLFVYEDPRIDEVEDMLPHANCGACGTAGCRRLRRSWCKVSCSPANAPSTPRIRML